MSSALALSTPSKTILNVIQPDWVWDILQDKTKNRRFWITKGLGSGGTYGAAIWHYSMCLINRWSKFSWAIAPTYQQTQDTLIPTFVDVFQNLFQLEEGEDYKVIRSQYPRIELTKYKQTIFLKSGNRPEHFVGPSISHCLMTEPGLMQRMAYEKSSARLRCPLARSLQYLGEGSPEGMDDWYEKEANFDEGLDETKNKRRIILWTDDNPVFDESYVQNLEQTYSYDPHKLQSYRYGLFVPFTKGTAYWEFKHSRNVKLDLRPIPNVTLTMTWDWNHTPLAWCALQKQTVWTKDGGKYDRYAVLAESTGKYSGILDSCAEFISQFPPEIYRDTPIEIDGGCDGYNKSHLSASSAFQQVYDALKNYYTNVSIVAAKAAPRIQARLQKHNAMLAYGYLVLPKWCNNTIKSHEKTNLVKGTWQIEKPQGDMVSHWGDALGTAIYRLTKHIDFEKPNSKQIYGFN